MQNVGTRGWNLNITSRIAQNRRMTEENMISLVLWKNCKVQKLIKLLKKKQLFEDLEDEDDKEWLTMSAIKETVSLNE